MRRAGGGRNGCSDEGGRQRLSVLDLAARLGNATEACRRRGMDRTSFYEWKRLRIPASLIMIKDQLGHAFIDSTMVYVKSMPLRTRSEYDFYKPAYM